MILKSLLSMLLAVVLVLGCGSDSPEPETPSGAGTGGEPAVVDSETGGEPAVVGGETGGEPAVVGGETGGEPAVVGGETGGEPAVVGGETGGEPAVVGGETGGEPAVVDAGGAPKKSSLSEVYDRGLDFLKAAIPGGNLGDPGMTALVAGAFLRRPGGVRDVDRPLVDGMLKHVAGFQKENGGIYDRGLANYTTCAAIMALADAEGEEYREAIAKAAAFVKSIQSESGGIGYSDKHPGDPDLSNTQFALESLRKAGIEKDDPVYSKALRYLQSVQNRSESNNARYTLEDGRVRASLDDGGAFYKPTESKAGEEDLPDGRVALRSYGSMTYALLKCYLLAGLENDDPRVKDVVKWIRNNYTLEENPGFDTDRDPDAGLQGLYYYYFTMAKALDLLGVATVKDADGLEHDWRKELGEKLTSAQKEDGSWANEADRWMEDNPVLATPYALVALSYCAR